MSLLPGVPNVSAAAPALSMGKASTGIARLARSVGKPGRAQNLGSVVGRRGAGMAQITGGDPVAHSLGHYGKNGPAELAGMTGTTTPSPTAHAGMKSIKGGSGGIRSHVREGGLGPGKVGRPGNDTNYSMADNMDVE